MRLVRVRTLVLLLVPVAAVTAALALWPDRSAPAARAAAPGIHLTAEERSV
jgi:hypothetical protein